MSSTKINANDTRLADAAKMLGGVNGSSYQDLIKIINASSSFADQLSVYLNRNYRLEFLSTPLTAAGADGKVISASALTDPASRTITLSLPNIEPDPMKSEAYRIAQVLAHELGHVFDPDLAKGSGLIGEARAEINAYRLMSEADRNLVQGGQNTSAAGGELFRANSETSLPLTGVTAFFGANAVIDQFLKADSRFVGNLSATCGIASACEAAVAVAMQNAGYGRYYPNNSAPVILQTSNGYQLQTDPANSSLINIVQASTGKTIQSMSTSVYADGSFNMTVNDLISGNKWYSTTDSNHQFTLTDTFTATNGVTVDDLIHYSNGKVLNEVVTTTERNGAVSLSLSGYDAVAGATGASVDIAPYASATLGGDSNMVSAGVFSSTALFGTRNVVNLVSNSGSAINLYTKNSFTTVNGIGNRVGIFATGNSVVASYTRFAFSAGGFTTTVYGGHNTVNAAEHSETIIEGGDNTFNLISNSGSTVHFASNSSGTVSGWGNTLTVGGWGVDVSSYGNTAFLDSGASASIKGNDNLINAAANTAFNLTGYNNTCSFVPDSGSVVYLHENSVASFVGWGNRIVMDGWDTRVATYGNTAWLAGGATGSFYGNDNKITAAGYTELHVSGRNNTCNLVSNSRSFVSLHENSETYVTGWGNTIGLDGWDTRVATYGNNAWLANGATGSFYGNDNVISATGHTAVNVTGQNNTLNLVSYTGSVANLHENSGATINGFGNLINIDGWDTRVTTNGNSAWLANGATGSFYGSDNMISAAGYTALNVTGQNNTLNLASYTGSIANLHENSRATINGFGNLINIDGWDTRVTTNGNNAWLASGATGSFYGSDNVISAAGYTALNVTGQNNTLNLAANSGSAVYFDNNSTGRVNGAGNTIGVKGWGNRLNTFGNDIYVSDNTSLDLSGGQDRVFLGAGSYLGLLDGNEYDISTHDSTVNASNNTSFNLSGSNNKLDLGENAAVAISGNGNSVHAGNHSVIVDHGLNNTLVANNSVVKLDSENVRQTIYVYGSGNYIDASALNNSNPLVQAKIVVRGTGNTIYANGNLIVDLHDTTGNFVTGPNIAVYANKPSDFERASGPSPEGTYGPLNPSLPPNTQISFPGYNPSGSGAPSGDGGRISWGDPEISMPWYDLPSNSCPPSGYNSDGTYNVVVCGVTRSSFSAAFQTNADVADPLTDSSEVKVQNLIAAMASFGADSSATSSFVTPAQNDQQMLLAVSAH